MILLKCHCVFMGTNRSFAVNALRFLDRLQVGDDGADIVAFEFELRHVRMARDDALAQGFLQRLDRIALRQGAEQRGLRMAAFAGAGGRMAARAILGEESLSPLEGERRPGRSPPSRRRPDKIRALAASCAIPVTRNARIPHPASRHYITIGEAAWNVPDLRQLARTPDEHCLRFGAAARSIRQHRIVNVLLLRRMNAHQGLDRFDHALRVAHEIAIDRLRLQTSPARRASSRARCRISRCARLMADRPAPSRSTPASVG